METIVAENLAEEAAGALRRFLAEALGANQRASLAISGGTTPSAALELLSAAELDWERVDLFQVDERMVPPDDPARNLRRLSAALADRVPAALYPMPVDASDPLAAAARYASELPPALDVVQLGLGADGHTASLVPGDAVLSATGDVAVTQVYQGQRRMTLTFAALNRARRIVWIVGGADKREAVRRLVAGDQTIPAGRIASDRAVLIADRAALGQE